MYPYDFKPEREWPQHDLVFVAMPFHEKFDKLWTEIIKPAVYRNDLKPWRADEEVDTQVGWSRILSAMFTAKLTIGVLTDHNPNVYYELGIAHSIHPIESQLLLAETGSHRSKFDLQHLTYIEYTLNDIEKSMTRLAQAIKDKKSFSEMNHKRRIREAVKSLTPFEYTAIVQLMENRHGSHFAFQNLNNEPLVSFLQGLFTKRMLRLSLTTETKIHSIYWTELGLHILYALELITNDELQKWLQEYRDHELNGRFLVSGSLDGTSGSDF